MTALLLVLAGAALAQPAEISADNGNIIARPARSGDLVVTRQVETDVAAMLTRIESELIPGAVNQAQQQAFNATVTAMAATTDQIFSIQANVAALQANVAAQLTAMTSQMDVRLSTVSSQMEDAQNAMRQEINESLTDASTAAAAQADSIDDTINATLVAVARQSYALNQSLRQLVDSKADASVHMWTGGCTSHGRTGWNEYCLNQVHHNTGLPYFTASGSRFRNIQKGYYVMIWWGMYKTSGWQHTRMYMGGRRMGSGYNRVGYHEGGNHWRDAHQTMLFPCQAGSQSWTQSYADSWNAWHSTNSNGDHSRITYFYKGYYSGN